MSAPRNVMSVLETIESLQRLTGSEMKELRDTINEQRALAELIKQRARAVLSLRRADDVAFRAAVSVLVTDILGAACWDSSNNETETMP